MSELGTRLASISSALAARYTARVVSRDLLDFSMRKDADLKKGVYTLVSIGERDFPNFNGMAMQFGRHRMLLVGQIRLAETAVPSDTEEAELTMRDEIKTFLDNLPLALAPLVATGWQQSAQSDHPDGWISFDLEFKS